ncbi:cation:proton antiporter [Chitinophaga costaii]|nr:cation:proton antiporter [Chitinophaga costaii]
MVILLLIFLLKRLNQPYPVAYILAGFLLGPQAAGIFTGPENIAALGEIGVLLLMFFLGMEIEVPDKRSLLLQPIIAQLVKTILALGGAMATGFLLHWKIGNTLILAILLLFNSTAVVSEFLRKTHELHTPMGKIALNILLVQDILIAPVFTLFRIISNKHSLHPADLLASITGCILIFLLLRSIRYQNLLQLPVWREMDQDHDLQVFTGAFICIGFALLASWIGFSGPVGSFVAGIYIGRTNAFHWLGNVLKPFKVFFVALFFISIGLMLDLSYIKANILTILTITLLIQLINSMLSAVVFRILRYSWHDSLYAGALLSQTGELGLLACSMAYKADIIEESFFKTALAVTGLTLLLSTAWINILRKLIRSGRSSNSKIATNTLL